MGEEKYSFIVKRLGHETDRAIQVTTLQDENIWFPLSQVHEIHRGEEPRIVVSQWIAKQKGLI